MRGGWEAVLPPEPCTQPRQKRVMRRLGEITLAQTQRIPFSAGRPADDERPALIAMGHGERHFCSDLIGCIDHDIGVRCAEPTKRLLREEFVDGVDAAGGRDGCDPLAHGVHLVHAKCGVRCMDLPVEVALGDDVEIHEREPPNPRPGEGFGRPRSDASQANHGHMSSVQPHKTPLAIQARHRGEGARRGRRSGTQHVVKSQKTMGPQA